MFKRFGGTCVVSSGFWHEVVWNQRNGQWSGFIVFRRRHHYLDKWKWTLVSFGDAVMDLTHSSSFFIQGFDFKRVFFVRSFSALSGVPTQVFPWKLRWTIMDGANSANPC